MRCCARFFCLVRHPVAGGSPSSCKARAGPHTRGAGEAEGGRLRRGRLAPLLLRDGAGGQSSDVDETLVRQVSKNFSQTFGEEVAM